MPNEDFAKRLEQVMKESGYQAYGAQKMPVHEKKWPSMKEDDKDPSQVTPGDPTLVVATPETTEDVEVNDDDGSDVIGAISSLFISMGFILQQAGVIEDKYDTQSIIDFLNGLVADNSGCDDVEVDVEPVVTGPEVPGDKQVPAADVPKKEMPKDETKPQVLTTDDKKKHSFNESRQLLESRLKIILKKK